MVPVQTEVIRSTQRAATVIAMKKELEVRIRSQQGNKKKFGICCITDDIEFQVPLKNIYSEGVAQLLLCCGTSSSLLDVMPNPVLWGNILQIEKLNEKTEKLIDPYSKSELPSPGSSVNSVFPDGKAIGEYKKFVRVSRFSMAAHLNNLIKWKEDEANGIPSNLADSSQIEDVLLNDDPQSQIEVVIDRDKRKQKIVISGKSEEITKAKVTRVESLLAKLSANRKVLRLHGWKSPHREAMMGSNPLSTMSQSFRTTGFSFLSSFLNFLSAPHSCLSCHRRTYRCRNDVYQ